MKKLVLVLFIVSSLVGCVKMKPGATAPPTTTSVQITNPLHALPVGPNGSQDFSNYSDLKVKILVQTFDASGNPVLYGPANSFTVVNDANNQKPTITKSVEVPESGEFAIQVFVQGTECVVAYSQCVGTSAQASKQEYFQQRRFNPGATTAVFTSLAKIDEECC